MFLIHQIIEITTTPVAAPKEIQILRDVSWKSNINKARKKIQDAI
jgi:hypothetical protein